MPKECLDSRQTETTAGRCRISVVVPAFCKLTSDRRYTIDFHLLRWHIVLPVFLGYAYAGDGYCAGSQMAGICVDERLLGEWAGSPFIYTMLIGIRSE